MAKSEAGKSEVRKALDGLDRKATRMEAIARLGELGVVQAIEPLLELCRRLKGEERDAVCRALRQITTAGPPGQVIRVLIERGVTSKRASVRRCALCALGAMGQKAQPAFKQVARSLQDEDPDVRMEGIDALGKMGDPRAVEPLLALLGDPDRSLRTRATDALAGLGEVAVGAVCQLLRTEPEVGHAQRERALRARVAAAHVLGRIGGQACESSLRQAYADRTLATGIRVATLSALSNALGKRAIPVVSEALREEDVFIRRQAVRCLCDVDTTESTTQLVQVYEESVRAAGADEKVHSLALKGLRRRYPWLLERIRAGDHAVLPVLLAVWRSMDKERAEGVEQIAQLLVGIGRPLVSALAATLNVRTPGADVIRVLGKMGPAAVEAHPALVAQLSNADTKTCCAAARALGALGDERAVAPLLACLFIDRRGCTHPQWFEPKKHKWAWRRAVALQRAAAAGLGALGKAALAPVMQAVHRDDPLVRRGGAMALGYIGGGQALRVLDGMAADRDPSVREAAAEAIERAAAGDVIRLGRLLEDEDDHVRARAVEALGQLEDLRSLDLLLRAYGDQSERVRKAVVRALVRREGERAYSILIAAAAGGNVSALRALEEHPTPQAIPALLEALDSPWSEVYTSALRTVRRYVEVFGDKWETTARPDRSGEGEKASEQPDLGGCTHPPIVLLKQAIPLLTSLLHDDSADVRRLALEALGAFRDPVIVPDLAVLLLDTKEDIRFSALHAIESMAVSPMAADGYIRTDPMARREAEAVLRAYVEREGRHKHIDEDLRTEIAQVLEQMSDVPIRTDSLSAAEHPERQAPPALGQEHPLRAGCTHPL
jgi:HEAT repeat protein